MRSLKLILLFIPALIISCNTETKSIFYFDKDFDLTKYEDSLSLNINLGLNDSLFIKDVEQKFKINLCDTTRTNIELEFNESKVKAIVPVFIKKSCSCYPPIRNRINYTVNKKNDVLIKDQYRIHNGYEASSIIAQVIRKHLIEYNKRHIILDFNWSKDSYRKNNDERFKQLLIGISEFKNSVSEELFQKKLIKCSQKQVDSINSKYLISIHINPYRYIHPPPPHPVPEEMLEILKEYD